MAGKPPIWTEPLELVCDGTPVVVDHTYQCGSRLLVREDGLPLTGEQHPHHIQRCLRVTPGGKHWEHCGPDDPVLVRNRVQMEEGNGLSEIERAREYVASSMHDRDRPWGDLVRAGERDDCPEMRMVLKAMRAERATMAEHPSNEVEVAIGEILVMEADLDDDDPRIPHITKKLINAMMAERDKGGEA